MTDYTSISIRRESKPLFEQCRDRAVEDLGEEPTQADVMEELCRAYLGDDPCGRWRESD